MHEYHHLALDDLSSKVASASAEAAAAAAAARPPQPEKVPQIPLHDLYQYKAARGALGHAFSIGLTAGVLVTWGICSWAYSVGKYDCPAASSS